MNNKWLIIPDVHGDFERMRTVLHANGFREHGAGFRHDEGRKALFLGDLIDNGSENRRVIVAVRAMVDAGDALCLMGNHELNAIMFHTRHRDHSQKNIDQHVAFLREFQIDADDTRDVINWFSTLPLRIDFGGFRAAHAFWGDDDVLAPLIRRQDDKTFTMLPMDILADLHVEAPGIASEILDVTKGPELVLPEGGYGFADHYGHWRTSGRLRWWGGPDFPSWEDAMISLGPDRRLPETRPGAEIAARAYAPALPPLFIGHYKMKGDLDLISSNVICLDFPQINPFAEADPETGAFTISVMPEDPDLRP